MWPRLSGCILFAPPDARVMFFKMIFHVFSQTTGQLLASVVSSWGSEILAFGEGVKRGRVELGGLVQREGDLNRQVDEGELGICWGGGVDSGDSVFRIKSHSSHHQIVS